MHDFPDTFDTIVLCYHCEVVSYYDMHIQYHMHKSYDMVSLYLAWYLNYKSCDLFMMVGAQITVVQALPPWAAPQPWRRPLGHGAGVARGRGRDPPLAPRPCYGQVNLKFKFLPGRQLMICQHPSSGSWPPLLLPKVAARLSDTKHHICYSCPQKWIYYCNIW